MSIRTPAGDYCRIQTTFVVRLILRPPWVSCNDGAMRTANRHKPPPQPRAGHLITRLNAFVLRPPSSPWHPRPSVPRPVPSRGPAGSHPVSYTHLTLPTIYS